MIIEVGLFRIDPTRADEFAPIADDIRKAFARHVIPGSRSFHIDHAVEDAGRWVVLAAWNSIGDHERFVWSDEGERQRALLEDFMVEPPEVFHLALDDVEAGIR
jgi:heme-degrading monooxygenase HmoA